MQRIIHLILGCVLQIRQFRLFTCPGGEKLLSAKMQCNLSSYYGFLMADDNIEIIRFYCVHDLLSKPAFCIFLRKKSLYSTQNVPDCGVNDALFGCYIAGFIRGLFSNSYCIATRTAKLIRRRRSRREPAKGNQESIICNR